MSASFVILILLLFSSFGTGAGSFDTPSAAAAESDGAASSALKPIPETEPDWAGLKRDSWHFMGYQGVVIALLATLPNDVTNWSHDSERSQTVIERWYEHVTQPEIDKDSAIVNYVLHPYWGAAYYIRGSERGLDRRQSFYYSLALSTLYEMSFEAVFEPVSIQDLIVTPVLGSLIGEYWFRPLRERIRAKPGLPTWTDKTVLALTDPLGAVGDWSQRIFGAKTMLSLQPIAPAGHGPREDLAWGLRLDIPLP